MIPARILVAFVAILSIAAPTIAQDGGSPMFHPFAFGLTDGDSAAPEGKVYDVRIPASFKIFTSDDDDWGLRLRIVLYGGIYDFTVEEAIDLDLKFESLAATPGVEFLVPVGKGWILKPFAEIGYGRDFDNDLDFGVWSVGMRSIVTWPVKKWFLSFGTKVQYLSTFTATDAVDSDFGEIRLGFDARHPLPFTIGGSQGDISGYYIRRQWVEAFIARDEHDPLEIRYTNEIGFTFGTTPKYILWFIPLPRIGLGYRFGPHIKGFRLNFGFPF
jgi:hypothetical protein